MTAKRMTPTEARYYRELGDRIRAARLARGLTQRDVARMVERRSAPAVVHWEKGHATIDPYTLRRLEKLLGTELF